MYPHAGRGGPRGPAAGAGGRGRGAVGEQVNGYLRRTLLLAIVVGLLVAALVALLMRGAL